MSELEDQRSGRNKATQVNKTYINSGDYRRKFDSITGSSSLNRLLFQLAKKMLLHRAGTIFEDMYWIDVSTEDIVASETSNSNEEHIDYSPATKRVIKGNNQLITIHSHPGSFPPSISDFNSNFLHGYQLGIVACHDGTVYVYSSEQHIREDYYNQVVADYLKMGYTETEGQKAALHELQRHFEIHFMEVTNDGI